MSIFNYSITNSSSISIDESIIIKAVDRWDSVIKKTPLDSIYGVSKGTYPLTIDFEIANLSAGVLGQATIQTAAVQDLNQSTTTDASDNVYPTSGKISFSADYYQSISTDTRDDGNSTFYFVVLHEIGHVLGIGPLFGYNNSPHVSYVENGVTKYYYIGTNGLREYRNYFNNQSLVGIPIEDDGETGTVNVHPEEGSNGSLTYDIRDINGHFHGGLNTELMTGWVEGGTTMMPLSRITIGMLDDIGYEVDYLQADVYMGFTAAMQLSANSNIVCFLEGTKICCLNDENSETYKPIEQLKVGDYIKTFSHGYIPICLIGNKNMINPNNTIREKNRLYVCKPDEYNELFEDLVITGCHCILKDELTEKETIETNIEMGNIYRTEDKYRLMAMLDTRAKPYECYGAHRIWHIALEHHDNYMNYGIYANGLLVESCSKRMLSENLGGYSTILIK